MDLRNTQGKIVYSSTQTTLRDTLREAVQATVSLHGVNLRGADLQGAMLPNICLQNIDLQDVNFQGAYLRGINLQGANMHGTNLQKVNLQDANLQEVNLDSANLEGADLRNVSLQGVNFQNANLWDTNLQGAYCQNTHFQGATLQAKTKYQITPLLWLYDQLKKIRLYKLVGENWEGPYNGGIVYTPGKRVCVKTANTDDTEQCGAGIHVATLDWCVRNWEPGCKILIVEFTAKDIACIPIATDGKIRLYRCKVIGEKDLKSLECTTDEEE